MRIVGALCWYWESPEFLERLVRSLEGVVDELVALDGPWQHFPHTGLASPPEQRAALEETAWAIGLPLRSVCLHTLWESQVAKRSFLYSSAAELGDWLLVVDGDEWVVEEKGLRQALSSTDKLVGTVYLRFEREEHRTKERAARRVFSTAHGLSVIETHNGVVTDDMRWLAGPRRVRKEPAIDLSPHLRIIHQAFARGDLRNGWSQRYYQTRARQRIEVH